MSYPDIETLFCKPWVANVLILGRSSGSNMECVLEWRVNQAGGYHCYLGEMPRDKN